MRKKLAILLSAAMIVSCVTGDFYRGNRTNVQAAIATAEEALQVSDLLDMSELAGWAAVKGEGLESTTGGGNAEPVVVTTKDEFAAAVSGNTPRVVVVSGKIISMSSGVKQEGGYAIDIGSNKTIVGMNKEAELYGGINIKNSSNVIVSNLNIHGVWPYTGPSDTVNIESSHHVWLNHLNVWNSKDGNIDTKVGADYITVSWCKLWYEDVVCEWATADGSNNGLSYQKGDTAYAKNHGHRLSCLVGSGAGDHDDTDMGKLHVTFHHNWFAENLYERMPRVMYGRAHIYNNYYNCEGNLYCIGVDSHAAALVENNVFENVKNPHEFSYPNNTALGASITARGNKYVNTTGKTDSGQKNSKTVELYENTNYGYYLHDAEDIKNVVSSYSGTISKDTQAPSKGTYVEPVKEEEKPEITSTPLPKPAAKPKSTDNPITYDKGTDTYTYHGQNKDGSNGLYSIKNPFAGKNFSETPTYDKDGYPVWTKGVTIGYWVKLSSGAADAAILNFQLENDRQIERSSAYEYNKCKAYSAADPSYSMGTEETYVDADGKEFKVLSGAGENVCYNPNYPVKGYYKTMSAGSAIYAYKKGTDPDNASNWKYLAYIGEGKYENYGVRCDEPGGTKSKLQEAYINGSFSLYASGTMGFRQDDATGRQLNPYLDNFGNVVNCHTFNQFFYFGNGSVYTGDYSKITPTMSQKGEWHYVVEVITNDWVQCYMDGVKLSNEYFNYFTYPLSHSKANIDGESFNLGFGASRGAKNYQTKNPTNICTTGMNLLDFISDEDTELYVGGTGFCAELLTQNGIKTPDGTQVKGMEFYDIPVPDSCIKATGIELGGGYETEHPQSTVEPTKAPEGTEGPTKKPEGTDGPTQKPEGTNEPTKAPEGTEGPTQKPENTEGSTQKPEGTEEPTKKPEGTEGPTQKPENTEGSTQKPEGTDEPTKAPEGTDGPTQKPEGTDSPTQKPEGTETPDKTAWGDIDGEKGVTLKDAQLALKIALRIIKDKDVTPEQRKLGDVLNPGDGIKLKDAQAILKRALRIPVVFDVEKQDISKGYAVNRTFRVVETRLIQRLYRK